MGYWNGTWGFAISTGRCHRPLRACTPTPMILAGCIMVNRKHPAERRRVSMLHEYGHLIVDRYKPGIDYLSMGGRKPANERFAEAFAIAFLMPAASVRQRFSEIVAANNNFQIADLCRLSHYYFASVEATALRLEQLSLIPKGSWALIKESKFAPRQAAALLSLPAHHETPDYYPERYKFLRFATLNRSDPPEQLSQILRCDPVRAKQVVMECLTSKFVADDGGVHAVRLEFQQSLLSTSRGRLMQDVALDACCLMNLLAAGTILSLSSSSAAKPERGAKAHGRTQHRFDFGLSLYVPAKVMGEALYIGQCNQGSTEPNLHVFDRSATVFGSRIAGSVRP